MSKDSKKICFVVSEPATASAFLKDHIKALSDDYNITLVMNGDKGKINISGLSHIEPIEIVRNISILKDLKAVQNLYRFFRQEKFDAIHSVTPKAGLITALAGKLAGIKNRIHIFTGQVWATKSGVSRQLLKSIDKIIGTLNTHLLVDGKSQRQFLINEGVLDSKNSRVLGAGSICGANSVRFTPSEEVRVNKRIELNISDDKVVFTFLGRLNHDKGIYELLRAFDQLIPSLPNAYLLLMGYDEVDCMKNLGEYPNIKPNENFKYYGVTSTPELLLQAGDVFCLPSYREGFGMSVVEASCLGLPVICSDAYGLAETMVDNVTGLRCKVGDVKSLKDAMESLYYNQDLRKKLGSQGRQRVLDLFDGDKIVKEWTKFYHRILD